MSHREQYPSLLCLRGYPSELRDALSDAAAKEGVSANTYAVSILASIYDVDFDTEAGRRLRAKRSDEFGGKEDPAARDPGSTLQLQLPPELNFRIHEHAMRQRQLLRDVVYRHLAAHLGVPYDAPVIKRGRPKRVAA